MVSSLPGTNPINRTTVATAGYSLKPSEGESFADTLSAVSKRGGDSSDEDSLDTVALSRGSSLLSKATLILPTLENVRKLSSSLEDELGKFFRESGIPLQPPVELSVDGEGKIVVKGDRTDTERIAELINRDADLAKSIHTLTAISSIAWSLPEHLQFQAEYRASRNPEAVVAKYSHLFGPQRSHEFSVRFGVTDAGDSLEVLADGKTWTQTNIPTSAWMEETIGNIADEQAETLLDTVYAAREEPVRRS